MHVQHPQAEELNAAYQAIGLRLGPNAVATGPARLSAHLQTPNGLVEIHTPVGAVKIRGSLTYFEQLARNKAVPAEVISATGGQP